MSLLVEGDVDLGLGDTEVEGKSLTGLLLNLAGLGHAVDDDRKPERPVQDILVRLGEEESREVLGGVDRDGRTEDEAELVDVGVEDVLEHVTAGLVALLDLDVGGVVTLLRRGSGRCCRGAGGC